MPVLARSEPCLQRDRFADPAAERAFRRRALRSDRLLMQRLVAVAIVITGAFVAVEAIFFQPGLDTALTLGLRAGLLLGSGLAFWALRRVRRPGQLDRAALAFMLLEAAFLGTMVALRPVDWLPAPMFGVLAILGAYAVVPVPTRLQAVASLTFTGLCVVLLLSGPLGDSPRTVLAMVTTYLAANVMGLLVSLSQNRIRRRAHHRFLRERSLRRQLQTARSELRLLRGIVPICSHCKRMRTESGEYQSVEQYVGERSDAWFSHTLCPDCLRQHFPAESEHVLGC